MGLADIRVIKESAMEKPLNKDLVSELKLVINQLENQARQELDEHESIKGEKIVTNIAKNNENICQEKPKPPQIVLRDFGDQEVIMEIRYYVPNAPLMRSTKSYYVKEILKQFEEQDVKLAYPTRLIMKEDIE